MVAERTLEEISNGGSAKVNLSFAGCGFLGIYHVGVASCIKEYAPHLLSDQVSGASAGALVAAAMLTNCCLGDATTYTLRIAAKARMRALGPLHPSFNIVKHLKEGLNTFLPDNAHEIANGRLNVSLTRVSDRQNVVVNQFDSKEELIQVLVCSSFVPFYCGILPPKYRGVRYVDGGLSDNIPILNENTLSVSPFAGESDICPTDISANDMHINLVNTSIQCTMGNLYRASYAFFPPHPEVLADMCKQGFDDALRFLQKNALISSARNLSIKSAVVTEEADLDRPVTISMSDSDDEDDDQSQTSDSSSEDSSSCDDCQLSKLEEPRSSLPPSVVLALQAACDSVNKGLLAPMYNSRAFRVISLITAPWILPVDVALVLAQRLYEWVPYMPSDMQWFVHELCAIAEEMMHFIKFGRHKYSARFTCQLAITELDMGPTSVEICKGATPVSSPFIQRRMMMKATERTHHHHHGPAHPARHHLPSAKAHRAVGGFNGPVRCADDLRHELLDDQFHKHFKLKRPRVEESSNFGMDSENEEEDEGEFVSDRADEGSMENKSLSRESHHRSMPDVSYDTYDQFENVLEAAENTDSILAFYYTEENNPGVVQVTEIFALDDPFYDLNSGGFRSRASSQSRKKSDTQRHALADIKSAAAKLEKEQKNIEKQRTENECNEETSVYEPQPMAV